MRKPLHRKPEWVRFTIPGGSEYVRIRKAVEVGGLHTVCTEARCPNMGECFNAGRATFLILGNVCTRNCRYCAVPKGIPPGYDRDEGRRVAEAVKELNLNYVVITSVTRDDLEDGGAGLYCDTIEAIRQASPTCKVEVLVPDFMPQWEGAIDQVIEAKPDVINHNIEVARNFYEDLRPKGNYEVSLALLERVAASDVPAKSGLMIGFGETMADIEATLKDLHQAGTSIVTVGQYLKASHQGFGVEKYYHPDEFTAIDAMARNMGFDKVLAGPMVRSSYHAGELGGCDSIPKISS